MRFAEPLTAHMYMDTTKAPHHHISFDNIPPTKKSYSNYFFSLVLPFTILPTFFVVIKTRANTTKKNFKLDAFSIQTKLYVFSVLTKTSQKTPKKSPCNSNKT